LIGISKDEGRKNSFPLNSNRFSHNFIGINATLQRAKDGNVTGKI
jgi:hypothetical protein